MKMKFALKTCALAFLVAATNAQCTQSTSFEINSATKLSFAGYNPSVTRTLNTGVGNKVVLSGYRNEPVINEVDDGTIQISLGEPCDGSPIPNPEAPDLSEGSSAASMTKYVGWGLAALVGHKSALAGSTLAMSMTVALLSSSPPTAMAQQDVISECELVPIEVEIYVDAMASEIVQMEYQTGEFEVCPPETMFWEHHPTVFGGYSGCVAELGLYPCASDAQGVTIDDGEFYAQSPVYWDGESCVETDFTISNRTFWILWGNPMDKYELNKRTGINPVVSFPFNRMPYATYEIGGDPMTSQDESNNARVMAKEVLEYIGAWTMEEMEDFSVTITEGAEQGMVHLFAAKAMEIAQTTCNRDINVLMEVPAYGYSTTDAAMIANQFASSFYNSSECECYATDSCKDPTVTVTMRGWLPNTPFPEATGGDGVIYAANSASPNSPWFESMVFPENPTGVIKTPQISDPNRRVCDGVYLWPMYLGARDFQIPKDEIPDCSAWSFSISKIYSAAARAGWIMYKKEPVSNHEAMVAAIDTSQTMTHGSLSEWTWHGQQQLFKAFMSKPLDDPTSWIGAYTEIMREKWDAILEGFADCPVAQLSNDYSGAYAWFVFQEPYLGVQDSSTPSFFRDVLGVHATTYSWGFRGATPSDFYGEGYGFNDFTRLQLYRDLAVYEEVGRRAKIVCADLDASVASNLVSVNQWVQASTATRSRRLGEGYETFEDRKRHLKESVPSLTERQLHHLANGQVEGERTDAAIASCAPDYTTHCLFRSIGVFKPDDF